MKEANVTDLDLCGSVISHVGFVGGNMSEMQQSTDDVD